MSRAKLWPMSPSASAKRTYDQYCGLARALDVLGERWTLLVIRELLPGPRRFTDLVDGLPGIGLNILTARLKSLEASGVIRRRRLPPPAASTVYELTDFGRELEPAVLSLMAWGIQLLGPPQEGDRFRPSWLRNSLRASFQPERARGVHMTCELRVDDEPLGVRVDDGAIVVTEGSPSDPDARVTLDAMALLEIGTGALDLAKAIQSGRVAIEGDIEAAGRLADICARPPGPTNAMA